METKVDAGDLVTSRTSTGALGWRLGAIVFSRLIISTSRRMMYTFALAFSLGLGVPLTSITSVIALNSAAGVLCPAFGFLGDRWGYKLVMLGGVAALSVGLLLGGFVPGYATLVVGLLLAGLAKADFDPISQAYVGEQVSYRHRGFAIGILETSWAGSMLVGIPLVGLLLGRFGWRSPLLVLGGLGVVGFFAVAALIPFDGHTRALQADRGKIAQIWREVRKNRAVLWALGFTFLIAAANDILFVVYGVWLDSHFGLTVAALGVATMVIGFAEILGEGLTALLSDRVGLGRALLAGMIATMFSYLLLLLVGDSLPAALAAIFTIFLAFEFTIVTSFAYFTELLPDARGTVMSFNLAAGSLGRVVGAILGGAVWLTGGMAVTSVSATLVSGLALACVVAVVRQGRCGQT